MIYDMLYGSPQAAYFLLVTFILAFLFYTLFRHRQRALQLYTSPSLFDYLIQPRSRLFTSIKFAACLCAWIAACFALMDPKKSLDIFPQFQETKTIERRPQEVIFLLDASASMGTPDGRHGESRLQEAKEQIDEIISQLKGQSISLYTFTSEPLQLVPSTLDYLFTRLVTHDIQMNEGGAEGTLFQPLLNKLKEKITKDPYSKQYIAVLLSDGGDNTIEPLKDQERLQAIAKLEEIIPNPRELNLHLFTIGIGSKEGKTIPNVNFNGKPVESKLQEDVLIALAKHLRGNYYSGQDWPAWGLAKDLLQNIQNISFESSPSPTQIKPVQISQYKLYYQVPLGIAIALLCLTLILPDVRRYIVMFLCLSMIPLQADVSKGLEAELALAKHDYESATEGYERILNRSHPAWQTPILLYNLGTIQIAQNNWDKALTFFHSIPLTDVSSPLLLAYIKTNQGLAYLIREEQSKEPEYQIYFLNRSIQYFQEAAQIECAIQQLEEAPSQPSCQPLTNLQQLLQTGHQKLQILKNQRREQIVSKLGQKDLDPKQHLILNYSLLSLSDEMKPSDIEALMNEVEKVFPQEKTALNLLKESLNQLHLQHFHRAQFFLNSSLFIIQDLVDPPAEKETDPEKILTRAVIEAKRGIQLNRLAQRELDPTTQESSHSILETTQAGVISRATPFLGMVLNKEKTQFESMGENLPETRCQKEPWAAAIPLFEEGFQEAKNAANILVKSPPDALASQEKTLADWQQVLEMLKQPRGANSFYEPGKDKKENPEEQKEDLLQKLQEMYLDDKPSSNEIPKEMHAW